MPKIMAIGVGEGYSFQLAQLSKFPQFLDYEIDIFDMRTLPEKGDAIDVLADEHSNQYQAIFAFHLFGISSDNRCESLNPDYFYNKRNHELPKIARQKNIPLYVMGDQPSIPYIRDHGGMWKEY